jgi:hypothetical protein
MHRLFANAKSIELLWWHGEEHKKDTMLRYLTDGLDWWVVNTMVYKNISGEDMHLWFSLSIDGTNPFDMVGTNHST